MTRLCNVRWLACVALLAACGGEREVEREAQRAPSPAPAVTDSDPASPEPGVEQQDSVARRGSCGDAEQCQAKAVEAERAGDKVRAAELLEHACDLASGQACFRLGLWLRDGSGVMPDEARSRDMFERGCRHGSTAACDALGH